MQSNDHKNAHRNLKRALALIGKSRRAYGVGKGEAFFPGRAELDMGSWVSTKK